jgi:hypothetical protein
MHVIHITADEFKELVQSLNDAQALLGDSNKANGVVCDEKMWERDDLVKRFKGTTDPTTWLALDIDLKIV